MASTLKKNMLNILNKHKRGFISVALRQKSTRKHETNIVKSVYKNIPVTNYTVNDFVWENLDRWPDKTATVRYYIDYLINNIIYCTPLLHKDLSHRMSL